ncbi:MAG: Fic family protein [archaeon]|nr:Fic family protein [Nanoarchaeota archaeon]
MKLVKKKLIRNRTYYYLEYTIRVNGKRLNYSKYVGDKLPFNLKELFLVFFEELTEFVLTKLGDKEKKYFPENAIRTIEKAKSKYLLYNHELFMSELSLFKTLYCILFVLNSNRAEGSKVTRSNIEEVMLKRVKPKTFIEKEIVNSIDAMNFAFSKEFKWNSKGIKTIHQELFKNISPEIAGKFKKSNVIVNNSETTDWKSVSKEMKDLLHWMKKNKKIIYPPQLALEFHWRFEKIHPFEDGNGRIGRILLNAILLEHGYAPMTFFSENHQSYCNAIAKACEGKKHPLAKVFVDCVKKTMLAIDKYHDEQIITGGSSKIGKWEIQRGKIRLS